MTEWPNPSVFGGEKSALEDELCQQLKPSNSNDVLLLPLWVLATRTTWGHCWRQIRPHGWDSLIILPSRYLFLWSKCVSDEESWEEKRCNGKRGASVSSQDEAACVLVSVTSSGEQRKNTALGPGRRRFKWLAWLEQISNSVSLFSSPEMRIMTRHLKAGGAIRLTYTRHSVHGSYSQNIGVKISEVIFTSIYSFCTGSS